MKTLILALMIGTAVPVQAQRLDFPKTMKLYNNRDGSVLGTATLTGRTVYLRDLNGEFIGSVVIESDGKKSFFDSTGKSVEGLSIAGGPVKLPDEP